MRNIDNPDDFIMRRLARQRMGQQGLPAPGGAEPVRLMTDPVTTTQPVGAALKLPGTGVVGRREPLSGVVPREASSPTGNLAVGSQDYLASQAATKTAANTRLSVDQERANWARLFPGVPFPADTAAGRAGTSREATGENLTDAHMQDVPLPSRGGNTGISGGMGLDQSGLSQTTAGSGSSLADAAKAAAAGGYTDIAGAEGLKAGNYVGSLEGFNTNAWGSGERGTNTMKNSFGKIASRYDPTQPGAAKAMMADADFRSLWPEAQLIDHPNQDQIDFDGPGPMAPVDVITSATAGGGGRGWAWQPQDEAGGGTAGSGFLGSGMDLAGILGGADPLNDIIKRIQDLQSGQTPEAEQRALMEMILGGAR